MKKIDTSYEHSGKRYEWAFNFDDPDEFYRQVTDWVDKALDGNVLFIGDEYLSAYCLPKAFVQDLCALGIHLSDAKNYFDQNPSAY